MPLGRPTPAVRAVLFDAGNTLFAERSSRAALYAAVARRHGVAIDDARMASLMGAVHDALPLRIDGAFRYSDRWFATFIAEVFVRAGFCGAIEPVAAELFATFRDPATFRLFPETRAVVKRLKGAGIRLAVVSNWSPSLPALLARLGLNGDFDAVVASALAQVEKPDPAIFRKALRALDLDPSAALHVGDHPENDLAAADGAGVRALLLDRDARHANVAGRIDSLSDVLPHLGLPPVETGPVEA